MEVHFTVWTNSGVHIPRPGLRHAFIEMIGCGGGGEPVTADGQHFFTGRGGGAGAYLRFILDAKDFGRERQVTICNGGLLGQFSPEQKRTFFGPSWVGGGSDGDQFNGFGGYQGNWEGHPLGWSAPYDQAAGTVAATFAWPPRDSGVFFHEGESGAGGLCFINHATPLPGQTGAANQIVTRIGEGGMGFFGGSLVNRTIVPPPPGWNGSVGSGGSGAVATPNDIPGTHFNGGRGGSGAVLVTEFSE